MYLVYGYHNWTEDRDKIVMRSSVDGRNFGNAVTILDDSRFHEFWNPELLIRPDGTWLLYITGRLTSNEPPKIFLGISTNQGTSFSIVESGGQPIPVLSDYRFGSVTTAPSGEFVFFATSNVDNQLYRLTSTDGITWSLAASLSTWGFDVSTAVYDTQLELYIVTLDPPSTIGNDCSTPTWKYPTIRVSASGQSFSYWSQEHFFSGLAGLSAEAAPLTDQTGKVTSQVPRLIYMTDQESASYNRGGSTSNIIVADWKRGIGASCGN